MYKIPLVIFGSAFLGWLIICVPTILILEYIGIHLKTPIPFIFGSIVGAISPYIATSNRRIERWMMS